MTYSECKQKALSFLEEYPNGRRVYLLIGKGNCLSRFRLEFFMNSKKSLISSCDEYVFSPTKDEFCYYADINVDGIFLGNNERFCLHANKWIDVNQFSSEDLTIKYYDFTKKIYNEDFCYTKTEYAYYKNCKSLNLSTIDEKIL